MVKIKREVEMTLPELIEWGLENGIKNKKFVSNRWHSKYVNFSSNGYVGFSAFYSYLPEDTFTVEVEEEITEETKIDTLVSIDRDTRNEVNINFNCSIRQLLDRSDYYYYYILNDDMTMTLIWKNGELV
ncbi:hypothetical protein SHJJP8905_000105 [Staphylococcus lugdunensis]|uniref:hypothetical protein n=1 Tax=Staphylococcus lugdunensis TaxID=28035 RepID=UPI001F4C6010|nr:hypothetical protein [Staphylococcus lugdunensis]MCH8657722.1 hypothetical protein [Staphylococcus lugdunensis]MCH8668214.1 hypothetical protein [Staphylococcus lugdunensis]